MDIASISRSQPKPLVTLKENKITVNQEGSKLIDSDNAINNDILTISDEAKEALEEKRKAMIGEMEEKLYLIENFREEMKAAESDENPYNIELKCLLISIRIINGDEVPKEDQNFLMEHKPDMYGNAILLRKRNEDPKKHESLLEDEEDDIEELSSETRSLLSKISSEKSASTESTPTEDI